MKSRLFYLFCLSAFIFSATSLSGQNYSIVDPGKQWNVISHSMSSNDVNTFEITISDEQTEFNGKLYREVKIYNVKTGKYSEYNKTFLREEGNIVYEYFQNEEEEVELYNFDVEIGDTLSRSMGHYFYFDLIVTDIDSVTLMDNSVRKRITLECSGDDVYTTDVRIHWVEGMGDYYGTLTNRYYCTSDMLEQLLCFHENDIQLWQYDRYDACIVTSINSITDLGLSVYPNPFTDRITVEGIEGKLDYRIYSLLGVEMMRGQLSGNTIDVDSLDSGVYFLLLSIDGKTQSVMIVK